MEQEALFHCGQIPFAGLGYIVQQIRESVADVPLTPRPLFQDRIQLSLLFNQILISLPFDPIRYSVRLVEIYPEGRRLPVLFDRNIMC